MTLVFEGKIYIVLICERIRNEFDPFLMSKSDLKIVRTNMVKYPGMIRQNLEVSNNLSEYCIHINKFHIPTATCVEGQQNKLNASCTTKR